MRARIAVLMTRMRRPTPVQASDNFRTLDRNYVRVGTDEDASSDARLVTAIAEPLVVRSLIQLGVGVADLQMRFTGSFGIQLESPIRAPGDADLAVPPYGLGGLALLLPLRNLVVTAVDISEVGERSLTIGTTTIRCRTDPDYKAWDYADSHGVRVVCGPDRKLILLRS